MTYTRKQIRILKRKYKLSQSAIKQLIDRQGNEISFCPMKFGNLYITKKYKEPDRETWKEGRLFEVLAIGGSSSHSKNESNELERKMPTREEKHLGKKGQKKIKELRIEIQAKKFKELAIEKNITYGDYNTQVVIFKQLGIAENIEDDILFRGEIDLGPILTKTISFGDTITLLDLKHSGDLSTEFGEYAWKKDEFVNKFQAYSYLHMIKNIDFELNDILNPGNNIKQALFACGYDLVKKNNPELYIDKENPSKEEFDLLIGMVTNLIDKGNINFIYWIFDSSVREENLMVPVEVNKMNLLTLHETLRKSISIVRGIVDYWNKNGDFEINQDPALCKNCPVENCEIKKNKEYLY